MAHYGGPTWTDTQPSRPLTLTDHFFLLAHGEINGKPRISLEVIGVGLAAATLMQLAHDGAIHVDPSTLELSRITTELPADEAGQYVLRQIFGLEPEIHTATDWITVLRDDLYTGVAMALEKAGVLKSGKSALTRSMRYIPTHPSQSEQILTWVYGVLRARYPSDFELYKQVLTVLVVALGSATAICAVTNDDLNRNYPAILGAVDPATASIAEATAQVRNKLSMLPSRR